MRLAEAFRIARTNEFISKDLLLDLELDLENGGFLLAKTNEVFEKMHNQELLCRSESFSEVMSAVIDGKDIELRNPENDANMCVVAGGSGFRTAMIEGFSGKDVSGTVKAVVTFRKNHLVSIDPITRDSRLWELKPETAQVSLRGEGIISPDDIEMVSLRFPVRFFPEEMLTEEEADRLGDEQIRFIVRHYIKTKSRPIHH